jgi:uncharacterized protein (TIGR03435 family)
MTARLLASFSIFVAAAFGQDTVPVKAGDRAPDINWNRIVSSPKSAKSQPNLAGQYTVLRFLSNITANAQAIGIWNEMIARFADKPVQFLWIASERWSAVQPFLREHPMNGWLLIDEKNEGEHAYGCEFGIDAIIDPSGNITGFTTFLDPELLASILDGKAVAIPRGAEDDEVGKLLAGGKVRLDSEPKDFGASSMPAKPDIPPSYEVHITPSKANGTEDSSGPDFWILRGFDLKTIVSMAYEKDPSRVALPKSLDNDEKFDFVVVLPNEEDETAIHQLVQGAIEKQFKVSPVVVSKPAEVYLMTAIKGKTPAAKTGSQSSGGGGFTSASAEFSLPEGTLHTPEAFNKGVDELAKHPGHIRISNISAANTTIDQFRKSLEYHLGRPIIDETGLEGTYDLEVHGHASSDEEFLRMLCEQTGLVLTPETRNIEILTLETLN